MNLKLKRKVTSTENQLAHDTILHTKKEKLLEKYRKIVIFNFLTIKE